MKSFTYLRSEIYIEASRQDEIVDTILNITDSFRKKKSLN